MIWFFIFVFWPLSVYLAWLAGNDNGWMACELAYWPIIRRHWEKLLEKPKTVAEDQK